MDKPIRPSDIVKFIDEVFPNAEEFQKEGREFEIHPNSDSSLVTILEMLDEMHEGHLQSLNKNELTILRAAKNAIKNKLEEWKHRGPITTLRKTPGISRENPVILIRRLIENCIF